MNLSEEQKIAVEAKGGVLVSAGAGSGKTAVLIEHLIFWIRQSPEFFSKNENAIYKRLKQLVVITFTVKAAHEMKLRLYERIEMLEREETGCPWHLVKKCAHRIFLGTIDGLCTSLIRKNSLYLPITTTVSIVSEQEWEQKIAQLFNQWLKSLTNEEEIIFTREWRKRFIAWAINVFSDTTNRLQWADIISKNHGGQDFIKRNEGVLLKLMEDEKFIENLEILLDLKDSDDVKKNSDKKWGQLILQLGEKVNSLNALERLKNTYEIFKEYKRLQPPRSANLLPYAVAIAPVKDFLKSNDTLLGDWIRSMTKDNIEQWEHTFHLLKSFYQFCDLHYGNVPGFCFADLNYYALLLLKNNREISNDNFYIVVDELQDTSEVQLDLIFELSGKNPKNLFGVGDVKQAIYGFRGGQSHVFFEFLKIVEGRQVSLKDNYRSVPEIVNFNNELFEKLLSKTGSYRQAPQRLAAKTSDLAAIETLTWQIPADRELYDWQQELLEYQALITKIKKILGGSSDESIAVLFRSNDQIKKFASMFFHENIAFSVQWKIATDADPLFIVFELLMYIGSSKSKAIETHELENSLSFFLTSLGIEKYFDYDLFFTQWKIYDCFSCFTLWMNRHNMVAAPQSPFLSALKSKSSSTESNFEKYLIWLDEIRSSTTLMYWTLPFGSTGRKQVILQTIHASKGLQYDHVLLARISSQKDRPDRFESIINEKNPFSFRQLTYLKKPWKSPCWYEDNQKRKLLSQDESLRLFYVACTRARKSLTMSIAQNSRDDSWASLVLAARDYIGSNSILELNDRAEAFLLQEQRLLPVFTSIIQNEWHKQFLRNEINVQDLKLFPSLSVTSLVTHERCPRKFYFQSVLGLTQLKIESSKEKKDFVSSATRGSKIHKVLQGFLSKDVTYNDAITSLDGPAKNYFSTIATNISSSINLAQFVQIESEIRFSWKDNIILGTPDVYLIHEDKIEIWDFKTGILDEEDRGTYELQLMWYALALFEHYPDKNEAVLKIIAFDEERTYETCMSKDQISTKMEMWWSNFPLYETKKLGHCSKCSYQVYCDRISSKID